RKTTNPRAGISRVRLRLPESQAQDVLRAQTETLRGHLPGFLRRRSARTLQRATRSRPDHRGRLSATPATKVVELRLPMDEREKIPSEQTSFTSHRPLRPARPLRPQ